jgi:diaminohydroxyphosphoribosylaminopyrimidine deaminase / 5-amino-6-(5-phosphoribosylamino)uracil reductase
MAASHLFTDTDEKQMRRALNLAVLARGRVEPNPMVGAVVLSSAGVIVGEGLHQKYGGAHAEVRALEAAGERAKNGTLYVTLEPCCHFGKTPPCTDLVLRSGVSRVVVAMTDPFPKVAGGGVKLLRQAGILVEVGLCEAEALELNAPYLKLIREQKPWVIAKWAMSLDGKIATKTGDSKWISSEQSRAKVHELRGRVDAILVGAGTVRADDPLLTARPPGARIATRVIVTTSGILPDDCQLLRTAREVPVIIYTSAEDKLKCWADAGIEVISVPSTDNTLSADAILSDLGRRRFTNVMLEGGAGLLGSFLDSNSIDEAWVFLGPLLIGGQHAKSPLGGEGTSLLQQATRFRKVEVQQFGNDVWIRGKIQRD